MPHLLRIHTTHYAPWQEGADERENLGTETETVEIEPEDDETLAEAVHNELDKRGITSYSEEGEGIDGRGGWFVDPTGYEHPYNGTYEDYSAHLSEDFTPAERRAVYDRTIRRKQRPADGVRMLTDAQARVAAAHWQEPSSAPGIASLASTGYISAHAEDQILADLRQHPVEGTLERRELQELLNYVRVTGVRPGVVHWSDLWDDDYEKAQTPGAILTRTDEQGRQMGSFNFATPDDALKVLHRTHGYSASHALQYEGYDLLDREGNSLKDQFVLRDYGTSRPTAGKGWSRKDYDYLAESLARLPERERLGRYFAEDLPGSSPGFDKDRFAEVVATEGWRGNPHNATPRLGRRRQAYLADMVRHYPGDRHALAHQLADSLRGLDPKFNREKFLAAAGTSVERAPLTGTVMSTDPGNDWRASTHLAPQTSEDAPRDAVQPSTERTFMSTDTGMAGGDVVDLPSSIQSAENLVASLGTYGPSLENFQASLRAGSVDGPPIEKAARVAELVSAAQGVAQELVDELRTRNQPAELLGAIEGSPGDTDWLMGRGGA